MEFIFPKVRNKAPFPSPLLSIEQKVLAILASRKKQDRSERHLLCWEQKCQFTLFVDGITMFIEIPKESPKIMLELVSKFKRPQDAKLIYKITCISIY